MRPLHIDCPSTANDAIVDHQSRESLASFWISETNRGPVEMRCEHGPFGLEWLDHYPFTVPVNDLFADYETASSPFRIEAAILAVLTVRNKRL